MASAIPTESVEEFMGWVGRQDRWFAGYIKGRMEAGQGEYPQQLMERCRELIEQGAGGDDFVLMVAHISATSHDRELYDRVSAQIRADASLN